METNITLYKNHGDHIGYWNAQAIDGTVYVRHAKKMDGKAVESQYAAEGKNIGRANETSPAEQAILEIHSKARLKLDKGYVRSLEEAQAPATNTLGLLRPMLATPLEKVKPEKIDWDYAFVQPKLDGHRALFTDGVLYSRQGKVLEIPHIVEAINESGLSDLHLDGELYLHGKSLQDLSRLIKKQTPESLQLEYHVYDIVGQDSFRERLLPLLQRAQKKDFPSKLVAVPTFLIGNLSMVMLRHSMWRDEGYEGTMLRHGKTPYRDGKRCQSLIKIKEFQDAEFRVVDVREGKPYIKPDRIYHVPVWTCETEDGKPFEVTAHGTMESKDHQWRTRNHLLGKLLTVKFHYLSRDGIPQLPVALRWREDV